MTIRKNLLAMAVVLVGGGLSVFSEAEKAADAAKVPVIADAQKTETLDPKQLKLAEELLESMDMKNIMVGNMMEMIRSEVKNVSEKKAAKIQAVLTEAISWDEAKGTMARLYCEQFTGAELEELKKFHATDAGRKLAKATPVLTARSFQISQKLLAPQAQKIGQAIEGSELVGTQLPELKVQWLGKAPEFAAQPMIVEFWATWCPPCRKSIPHLNEVHAKYKEKGLVIVGISDEEEATVRKFIEQQPMDYFPALDPGGTYSQHFSINGIPHAFIVDKSGKIVWEGHPMEMKDADIEKAL